MGLFVGRWNATRTLGAAALGAHHGCGYVVEVSRVLELA
jgi:hypothetical protein